MSACMCVCAMGSFENLVKVTHFLYRKQKKANTTYSPKCTYNFQSSNGPFEIHAGKEKQNKYKNKLQSIQSNYLKSSSPSVDVPSF